MSIARIRSFAFSGIEAVPVEVQVQISSGLPAFLVVGLGTGFKAPVVASVLMAEAPAHVRAAAAGLNFSCIFLGQFLGPFVLRLLAPFGIQGTFLITGATLMATSAAIAIAGIGKEKHRVREGV